VYGILAIQFIYTLGILFLFTLNHAVKHFIQTQLYAHRFIVIIAMVLGAIAIVALYIQKRRQNLPTTMLLVFIYVSWARLYVLLV